MKNGLLILAMILLITGCKKDVKPVSVTSEATTTVQSNRIPKGYIMTPVGLMKAEHVHVLEKGQSILFENGHAFRVPKGSRSKIEDLGEVRRDDIIHKSRRMLWFARPDSNTDKMSVAVPSGGITDNWVTYSDFN